MLDINYKTIFVSTYSHIPMSESLPYRVERAERVKEKARVATMVESQWYTRWFAHSHYV